MYKNFGKFFLLSRAEKREIFRIYFLMWSIRSRLWATSYQHTDRWCHTIAQKRRDSSVSQSSLLRLINGASTHIPKATCLTKAMTAHTLLRQYGYGNRMLIGVKKTNGADFEAHAWIENEDGEIIFGGDFSSTFKPIMIC